MTHYTLCALATQQRAWSETVAILALVAGLINACLMHHMTATRFDAVAAAQTADVNPVELVTPDVPVTSYTATVTALVMAVVGQLCVQVLHTNWTLQRLAGALPHQVLTTALATMAVLGLVACVPGTLLGRAVAQPFTSVLTRLAVTHMRRIEVVQAPTTLLLTVPIVVTVAALGAVGPTHAVVRTPAVETMRDTASEGRRRMGVGRWTLVGVWVFACAGQLFVVFLAPPGRKTDGLPTGGGQATLALLLLAVLVVLLTSALIPGLLRLWSVPLTRLGGPWLIARRSALWRSELSASTIGLLALTISFTVAFAIDLATGQATVETAHLDIIINQVDSLVLATTLGVEALLGAVAVVSMSSRSRQRELAVLRCTRSTVYGAHRWMVIETALYVGTALLISLLPLVVAAAGEFFFCARAGMSLIMHPGIGPVLPIAPLSSLALVVVLLAPIRGTTRAPIGVILAAE